MKTLHFLAASFAILSIVSCKQQEAATSTAPLSVAATDTGTANPQQNTHQEKSTQDISKIDFSHYSGVIKPGAFGYFYGLTPRQIESAGIILETLQEEGLFTIVKSNTAPIPWSDAENYILYFYQGKLLGISAAGKKISDDITGREGKAAYLTLRQMLEDKYGKTAYTAHRTGLKLWDGEDEFYQCLAYEGCGVWNDGWEVPGKHYVSLSLEGLARGEGYILLNYESNPELNNARDMHAKSQQEITKNGL